MAKKTVAQAPGQTISLQDGTSDPVVSGNVSVGIRFTSDTIYCYAVAGEPQSPTYIAHKKFSLQPTEKWTDHILEAIGYVKAFQEQCKANCGGMILMHHGAGNGMARTLNDSVMAQLRLEGATFYILNIEFSGRLAVGNRKQISKLFGSTAPDEYLSTKAKDFRNLANWAKIGVEFKEAGGAAVGALEKFTSP